MARDSRSKRRKDSTHPTSLRSRLDRDKEIMDMHVSGMTLKQISLELNKDEKYVFDRLSRILENVSQYYSTPSSHHTFARFATFTMGLIDQLQDVNGELKKDRSVKAKSVMTANIKAQWELYKGILQEGKTLGAIREKPKVDKVEEIQTTPQQIQVMLRQLCEENLKILDRVDTETVTTYITKNSPDNRKIREVEMDGVGKVVFVHDDWRVRRQDKEERNLEEELLVLRVEHKKIIEAALKKPSNEGFILDLDSNKK